MDAATVADLFRQIQSGEDIPKIDFLLKRTSVEQATQVAPGWPYSILTNLAHADYWQRIWLSRIEGTTKPKSRDDWRVPDPSEFAELRKSFLDGLKRAAQISETWPIEHKMNSDDEALHLLVSLAVHNAYHIGQMKLMALILSGSD